jgi:hypothetical protein
LAAIAHEVAAESGRLGALREAVGIAGYALRLRAGLGPDRTAPVIVAGAAPLAVAVMAGSAAYWLAQWYRDPASPFLLAGPAGHVRFALALTTSLLWPATLLAVWVGRWTATRLLGTLAALTTTASATLDAVATDSTYGGPSTTIAVTQLLPGLLTVLLLAAAPRELLGSSPRHRRALAATTVLALVPWTAHLLYPYPLPLGLSLQDLWPCVLVVALLCMARSRKPALAVAPQSAVSLLPALHPLSATGVAALLLLAAAAAVAIVTTNRPRRPTI